jgi:hypothetical protein
LSLAKVIKWFCGCHYGYWCAQSGKTVREELGEVGWRGEKFQLEEDLEGVDPWDSFPWPEILILQDLAKLPFHNC